jgi:hypothetical protein
MAFLGDMWNAAAGTMLLFAPGWAVKLAGLCLIARAADAGGDPISAALVCAISAVVAWGFKTCLLWELGQAPANPQSPSGDGERPPGS